MRCPFCGSLNTIIIDSRSKNEGVMRRRRYECNMCGERFSTMEVYQNLFHDIDVENKSYIMKLEQIQNILHQEGEV